MTKRISNRLLEAALVAASSPPLINDCDVYVLRNVHEPFETRLGTTINPFKTCKCNHREKGPQTKDRWR